MSGLTRLIGATCAALLSAALPLFAQNPGLKIVVLEGEDAVNVIQQKTAVAPIVEVRDRNDQPVAGVVVRFVITRGRATFGGANALTVTTDVAGRAAVTGLTPTGAGALQISATATFEGQTAVATISQTNVTSIAAGSGAGGAGTATGTAAVGGGGGLSATTLGVIGGAAAGGAVAAAVALGGSSDGSSSDGTGSSGGGGSGGGSGGSGGSGGGGGGGNPPVNLTTYTGPLNGSFTLTTTTTSSINGTSTTCVTVTAIAATVTMRLGVTGGSVTGDASAVGSVTQISNTGAGCPMVFGPVGFVHSGPVTGTVAQISFSETRTTGLPPTPAVTSVTLTASCTGSLSGGVVNGTWVQTETRSNSNPAGTLSAFGTASYPVTLR